MFCFLDCHACAETFRTNGGCEGNDDSNENIISAACLDACKDEMDLSCSNVSLSF